MAAKTVSEDKRAEQKAIKEICNHIRKQHETSWFGLFNDVMGLGVAEDYEKNFDSGEVGQKRFALIKDWLLTHEPDLAYAMAPHLFPRSLRTQWQGLLEERARYGRLHTKPFGGTTLHQISDLEPIGARLSLGDDFTIELDSPIAGSVIALNGYRNEWYPLCLRAETVFDPVPVTAGLYGFPIRNSDPNQIVPMRQSRFEGEHHHCFIVGPSNLMGYYSQRFIAGSALGLPFLGEMAKRLMEVPSSRLAVLRENVLFK